MAHVAPTALIRYVGHRISVWSVGAFTVALLFASPLFAIAWLALFPEEKIWGHLADTVLPHYVITTVLLGAGVCAGVVVLGAGTAWLVSLHRFPGRRFFSWALVLPLAMPAYVIAYTYTDFLEYAGPVQGTLRALFGWTSPGDYWFPEIRSLGGATCMLALVLYPYVYVMARSAFAEQSLCILEVSRTLGRTPLQGFLYLALPLARPAVAVGVSLALMEALNDFGTVDYFAVQTLTAGVYDTWFGMGNAGGAAQIALVLLVFVVAIIWLERASRRRQRHHHGARRHRPVAEVRLGPVAGMLASLACAFPFFAGFLLPVLLLVDHSFNATSGFSWQAYLSSGGNSLMLATLAALLTVAVGIFLGYARRLHPGPAVRTGVRIASFGYAVPGTVLAVGILIPAGGLDNALDAVARDVFGHGTGLLLSGSIAVLLVAYMVRFSTISIGAVESGLGRITPSVEMAARTLGHTPLQTLARVHLPLMRRAVLAAAILVFVDTMKELPATLMMRPFNFETLATFVYQYASDELLEESAPAALTIVAAGILPLIVLNYGLTHTRSDEPS